MAQPKEAVGSCPKCFATLVGSVQGERLTLTQDNSRLRRHAEGEALLREKTDYAGREQTAREAGDEAGVKKWASRGK